MTMDYSHIKRLLDHMRDDQSLLVVDTRGVLIRVRRVGGDSQIEAWSQGGRVGSWDTNKGATSWLSLKGVDCVVDGTEITADHGRTP